MNYFYEINQKGFRKPSSFYLNSDKMKAEEIDLLALRLKEIILNSKCENKDIIFLCIGSDRYVGDSLGPLVGSMLEESQVPYRVYGTLDEPVHAFNLKGILKDIHKQFRKPLVFCIDACLGTIDQVGYIIFEEGPLTPGKALEKILPEVGDFHFKGMVNYIDPLPKSQFLNDTRLSTVMKLAKLIAMVITRIEVVECSPVDDCI